ncbi:MAG: HDOD domain-containing protein, partial [Nitrospinae bacterium]|nr:HDOD domain-containing protein [Nitrospinota bacterium]
MDQSRKRIFIQKIDELPTLPVSLLKIIEVIENPESSAQDLAAVISRDQSISSVILRLVNSAFYGHLRQISSMSHAVVILGYQTVKTMALGVSVFQNSPHA